MSTMNYISNENMSDIGTNERNFSHKMSEVMEQDMELTTVMVGNVLESKPVKGFETHSSGGKKICITSGDNYVYSEYELGAEVVQNGFTEVLPRTFTDSKGRKDFREPVQTGFSNYKDKYGLFHNKLLPSCETSFKMNSGFKTILDPLDLEMTIPVSLSESLYISEKPCESMDLTCIFMDPIIDSEFPKQKVISPKTCRRTHDGDFADTVFHTSPTNMDFTCVDNDTLDNSCLNFTQVEVSPFKMNVNYDKCILNSDEELITKRELSSEGSERINITVNATKIMELTCNTIQNMNDLKEDINDLDSNLSSSSTLLQDLTNSSNLSDLEITQLHLITGNEAQKKDDQSITKQREQKNSIGEHLLPRSLSILPSNSDENRVIDIDVEKYSGKEMVREKKDNNHTIGGLESSNSSSENKNFSMEHVTGQLNTNYLSQNVSCTFSNLKNGNIICSEDSGGTSSPAFNSVTKNRESKIFEVTSEHICASTPTDSGKQENDSIIDETFIDPAEFNFFADNSGGNYKTRTSSESQLHSLQKPCRLSKETMGALASHTDEKKILEDSTKVTLLQNREGNEFTKIVYSSESNKKTNGSEERTISQIENENCLQQKIVSEQPAVYVPISSNYSHKDLTSDQCDSDVCTDFEQKRKLNCQEPCILFANLPIESELYFPEFNEASNDEKSVETQRHYCASDYTISEETSNDEVTHCKGLTALQNCENISKTREHGSRRIQNYHQDVNNSKSYGDFLNNSFCKKTTFCHESDINHKETSLGNQDIKENKFCEKTTMINGSNRPKVSSPYFLNRSSEKNNFTKVSLSEENIRKKKCTKKISEADKEKARLILNSILSNKGPISCKKYKQSLLNSKDEESSSKLNLVDKISEAEGKINNYKKNKECSKVTTYNHQDRLRIIKHEMPNTPLSPNLQFSQSKYCHKLQKHNNVLFGDFHSGNFGNKNMNFIKGKSDMDSINIRICKPITEYSFKSFRDKGAQQSNISKYSKINEYTPRREVAINAFRKTQENANLGKNSFYNTGDSIKITKKLLNHSNLNNNPIQKLPTVTKVNKTEKFSIIKDIGHSLQSTLCPIEETDSLTFVKDKIVNKCNVQTVTLDMNVKYNKNKKDKVSSIWYRKYKKKYQTKNTEKGRYMFHKCFPDYNDFSSSYQNRKAKLQVYANVENENINKNENIYRLPKTEKENIKSVTESTDQRVEGSYQENNESVTGIKFSEFKAPFPVNYYKTNANAEKHKVSNGQVFNNKLDIINKQPENMEKNLAEKLSWCQRKKKQSRYSLRSNYQQNYTHLIAQNNLENGQGESKVNDVDDLKSHYKNVTTIVNNCKETSEKTVANVSALFRNLEISEVKSDKDIQDASYSTKTLPHNVNILTENSDNFNPTEY